MGAWFSRQQSPSSELDVTFVSLGMVVLDELRFPREKPLSDVMGGSASYSIGLQPDAPRVDGMLIRTL